MKPSVTITSLSDAKNYFGEHSHFKLLIGACDAATNEADKQKALLDLAANLKAMVNAEVSGLESEANRVAA